jgi:methylase of polypeptide subunit release factors
VDNIETLEGSFFEPVRRRNFDLIVANLPYVISPENKYIYRDSGKARDAGLFNLLREIPTYLNESGFAHILANWILANGQPYWQPVVLALNGLPVDTLLIHNATKIPAEYVEMWIDVPRTDPAAYEEKKKDWLAWYQAQQIELIAMGAVNLRRRTTGRNWSCGATVKSSLSAPAGQQIFELFQAQDDLSARESAPALEGARLVCRQPIQTTQLSTRRVLVQTSGMELSGEVSSNTIDVIHYMDGRNTLLEAIQLSKVSPENIDGDIRLLISLGILGFAD